MTRSFYFLACSYEVMALIQSSGNNYNKALVLWFKILELASELEYSENFILTAFLGIGELYQISDMLDEAGRCFQYAWESSQDKGDIHLIVKCGLYLSSIYSLRREYQKLSDLLSAMESFIADASIDPAWKIDYSTYECQVVFAQGHNRKAAAMSVELIDQAREYHYMWGLWKASDFYSQILMAQGKYQKAVESLCTSIDEMSDQMPNVPSRAFQIASDLWEHSGNYENALKYIKKYRERNIVELSKMRENKILIRGNKARFYKQLMENYFLRWQLHVLRRSLDD